MTVIRMLTPSEHESEPDDPRYLQLRAERDALTVRLGFLVDLLRVLDRTVLAHAAAVSKSDPRLKELVENLEREGLLDVDRALGKALPTDARKAAPLTGYCGLLLRWV